MFAKQSGVYVTPAHVFLPCTRYTVPISLLRFPRGANPTPLNIYIYSFYAADQGNEVYGGGEESVGIFLHRSSDDGIVKGEGMELKANLGRSM